MAVADQSGSLGDVKPMRKERTPLGDAFQQLLKNKLAVVSGLFIIAMIVVALFADYLNPFVLQGYGSELERTSQPAYAKLTTQDISLRPGETSNNPNLEGFVYWFGADNLGRDLVSRTLYGARVSLAVAFIAGSVSLVLGVVYGIVAGYAGGRTDDAMMRFVDFLYGLPLLIVILLVQVFFKSLDRWETGGPFAGVINFFVDIDQSLGGIFFVFVVLGGLSWLNMARIARGQTLSVKRKEYVEAAKAIGVKDRRIIFKQILPNILGPCIVQETLQIPTYILTEAFLSFIGLGVNPPVPSWGIMINDSYQAIRSNPHELVLPAVALTLTVLAFNFLGDGLRDAFDPRLRE